MDGCRREHGLSSELALLLLPSLLSSTLLMGLDLVSLEGGSVFKSNKKGNLTRALEGPEVSISGRNEVNPGIFLF